MSTLNPYKADYRAPAQKTSLQISLEKQAAAEAAAAKKSKKAEKSE